MTLHRIHYSNLQRRARSGGEQLTLCAVQDQANAAQPTADAAAVRMRAACAHSSVWVRTCVQARADEPLYHEMLDYAKACDWSNAWKLVTDRASECERG